MVIAAIGVLSYYVYTDTHQPAKDPKFDALVTSISDVKSDEYLYVKVNIDSMNVRSTNVITSANIVGTVIKDDIYKVIDIKRGSTFYWYKIEDKNGALGYIPSGSDELYIETFIKKNNERQNVSAISDYKGTEYNPIDGTTTTSTTTTTSSITSTTTQVVPTTKTTTTKTTKTTKQVTTKATTTQQTQTTKKKATGLQLRAGYNDSCDGGECIYYIYAEAIASGGEEPYEYDIKIYKNGQLYKQNINYSNTIKAEIETGDYLVVASVIGTKLSQSIEVPVEIVD